MEDEFEDSTGRSSDMETSHPDIDSALELYIDKGDFSYKTRTVDGTTEHIVMKMKNNQWKKHLSIPDEEVRTFDTEELVTFLIHQIRMDRAIKRRVLGLILIALLIGIPVVLISNLILGIQFADDFVQFLIAGGITISLIPFLCFMMSSAERSVDDSVYALRPNLIDVFNKMMDLKEGPYLKRAIEKRIHRLRDSNPPY